jgi:hypothetical protein
MRKSIVRIVVCLWVLNALFACGGGGGGSSSPNTGGSGLDTAAPSIPINLHAIAATQTQLR